MQVNIKIDDNLYRKLKQNAKDNHRTITAQLGVILSNTLEATSNTTNKLITNSLETIDNSITNTIDNSNKYHIDTIEKPKPKRRIIGGTEEDYNNFLLNNLIKFLDDEQISPNDTSWELLEGIKKQVPEFKNLNITVFDKAQRIRKENN